MRRALLLGALSLSASIAGSAHAGPSQTETRSCAPVGASFNLHVSGHKLAGYWLRLHVATFAPVPAGTPLVAVWSFGSEATRAPVLFAWSTAGKADVRARCRTLRSARPPGPQGLRPAFRVRDGWALSRRYECNLRGRLAIRTQSTAGGMRLTVWMERSQQIVAVADVVRGGATLRASSRCVPRTA